MENNLKCANFGSFYGFIRSFSRVRIDAKLSENQVLCLYKFYCFTQTAAFIPK